PEHLGLREPGGLRQAAGDGGLEHGGDAPLPGVVAGIVGRGSGGGKNRRSCPPLDRHPRACPGGPRVLRWTANTWMAGTSPAMTVVDRVAGCALCSRPMLKLLPFAPAHFETLASW